MKVWNVPRDSLLEAAGVMDKIVKQNIRIIDIGQEIVGVFDFREY